MSLVLDRQRLQEIVAAVAERLSGDWLLVGGALVALWLEPRRVTADVDLVGLGGTTAERLALMELAQHLGLPVEAVNSASDFFVRRIEGWREEIHVFHTGTRGTIYRPTPTLFLLLKVARLSEQDLSDCLAVIDRARRDGLPIDRARVLARLDAMPASEDPPRAERVTRVRAALRTGS